MSAAETQHSYRARFKFRGPLWLRVFLGEPTLDLTAKNIRLA